MANGKKNKAPEETRGIGLPGLLSISILALPGFVFACFGIYQGLRSAYCNFFFGSKDHFTALWCSYISREFRADAIMLVLGVSVLHLLVFPVSNKNKNLSALSRTLFVYVFLGGLGYAVKTILEMVFKDKPWW